MMRLRNEAIEEMGKLLWSNTVDFDRGKLWCSDHIGIRVYHFKDAGFIFRKYNFYWDNWRSHYYYFNGVVWVSKSKAPTSIADVDLLKETYYELDESEDDNDEIDQGNKRHKEAYPRSN